MALVEKLELWVDEVARGGPESMAVDEWLLETAEFPVLRVYDWAGAWASLGYFGKIAEARAAFPGVELVRRWTGGGMVDHRVGWTYTLVVPKGEPLAATRGAASYGCIHGVLCEVLRREGVVCRVSAGEEETGAASCFENPVGHDLVGEGGGKLAGAGQRRSRTGLLHQGAVASPLHRDASRERARVFAELLARRVERFSGGADGNPAVERATMRYARCEWTFRR
jgi:lipoyl(octanoyl) transferase